MILIRQNFVSLAIFLSSFACGAEWKAGSTLEQILVTPQNQKLLNEITACFHLSSERGGQCIALMSEMNAVPSCFQEPPHGPLHLEEESLLADSALTIIDGIRAQSQPETVPLDRLQALEDLLCGKILPLYQQTYIHLKEDRSQCQIPSSDQNSQIPSEEGQTVTPGKGKPHKPRCEAGGCYDYMSCEGTLLGHFSPSSCLQQNGKSYCVDGYACKGL